MYIYIVILKWSRSKLPCKTQHNQIWRVYPCSGLICLACSPDPLIHKLKVPISKLSPLTFGWQATANHFMTSSWLMTTTFFIFFWSCRNMSPFSKWTNPGLWKVSCCIVALMRTMPESICEDLLPSLCWRLRPKMEWEQCFQPTLWWSHSESPYATQACDKGISPNHTITISNYQNYPKLGFFNQRLSKFQISKRASFASSPRGLWSR